MATQQNCVSLLPRSRPLRLIYKRLTAFASGRRAHSGHAGATKCATRCETKPCVRVAWREQCVPVARHDPVDAAFVTTKGRQVREERLLGLMVASARHESDCVHAERSQHLALRPATASGPVAHACKGHGVQAPVRLFIPKTTSAASRGSSAFRSSERGCALIVCCQGGSSFR